MSWIIVLLWFYIGGMTATCLMCMLISKEKFDYRDLLIIMIWPVLMLMK